LNREDRKTLKDYLMSLESIAQGLDELRGDLEERSGNVQEHFDGGPVVDGLEEDITAIEDCGDAVQNAIDLLEGVVE